MEKNQNGEPRMRGEQQEMPRCQGGGTGGGQGGNGAIGFDCQGDDSSPLGYATFPIQSFRLLYSAPDALKHGTLFEELNLPKGVYNNG